MTYQHLTIEEREKIQEMLWQKASLRTIAKAIDRSPASVSREIKRNKPPLRNRYSPRVSHLRALDKRKQRGRVERLKSPALRQYVVSQLKLGWSPEQISATAQQAVKQSISHEAIYQYIYAQIHRDGYGYPKSDCEDLRPYLARRKKRRTRKGKRRCYRVDAGPLPSIEDRPAEVNQRIVVGHWEDDSVVSRSSKHCLHTTNERKSGLILIGRAKNRTMEEANRISLERLSSLPAACRKTLTRDRGSENLGYAELEEKLGIKCFFAHAYSSWERGSNENLNGLIRRFFPKKTDFRTVTDAEIQRVEHLLNSRPRKRLAWKTPYEVFYELTGVALEG